jgi:hypothetical protein
MVLVGAMSFFYQGVIRDNDVLQENPMYAMLNELDLFMTDADANVSEHWLWKDYGWLRHSEILVSGNCSILSNNLRYLRYTGYAFAAYNTLLMHLLLSGTLPASVVSSVPIVTSLISDYIGPGHIVWLGLFEFTQMIISWVIMGIYVRRKDQLLQLVIRRRNLNKIAG